MLIPVILAGGTGSRPLAAVPVAVSQAIPCVVHRELAASGNPPQSRQRHCVGAYHRLQTEEHRFLVAEQCRAIGIDWQRDHSRAGRAQHGASHRPCCACGTRRCHPPGAAIRPSHHGPGGALPGRWQKQRRRRQGAGWSPSVLSPATRKRVTGTYARLAKARQRVPWAALLKSPMGLPRRAISTPASISGTPACSC